MEKGENEESCILTVFWRIENIGLWETGSDVWTSIYSPAFIARTIEGKRFQLILDPKGVSGNERHLSLHLFLLDDSLNFPINCEWSFISSNGSPLMIVTKRNHFVRMGIPFYMTPCPTHEEVFVTKKSAFLPQDTLTVRFRAWHSNGYLSNGEFIYCRSRYETTDYSFLWHIPNFSAFRFNQVETTPIELGDAVVTHNFLLTFSFEGACLADSGASVELTPNLIPTPLIVTLKVSVLVDEQKVLKSMEFSSKKYFSQNCKETLILPKFIWREELLRKKNICLRNDTLTLRCEIPTVRYARFIEKYYYGSSNMKFDNIMKESSTFLDASSQTSDKSDGTLDVSLHREDPMAYLGEDLLGLYQEQRLADFELRAGDISFPVHKMILSARSPVFKAMFSSDMKESDSNSQDVPDLDVHTLNRMLTFLYGGTVEQQLQWEDAAKLYYAADKYQVQSLKQQCCSIFRSNITVSNVSEILKLADRHPDNELISFTHEFVLSQFDEIMQSKEWENFVETDSYLAAKTVHELCKKKLLTKRI